MRRLKKSLRKRRKNILPTCEWKQCKRPIKQYTLTGKLGKSERIALCAWHFKFLDAVNRINFWRRNQDPAIAVQRIIEGEDVGVVAAYDMRKNTILFSPRLAALSPEHQVYVFSHETAHWILCREFGLLTSMCYDLIYNKPLRCLGYMTLQEYETEGLNTSDA